MSVTQENLIKTGKIVQHKFQQVIKGVSHWFGAKRLTLKFAIFILPLILVFAIIITPFPSGSTLNNGWDGISQVAKHVKQNGYEIARIYNTPMELSTYKTPGILIIQHIARSYTTDEIQHLFQLVQNGWSLFIAEEINSEITRAFNIGIEAFMIREESAFVDDPIQPLLIPTTQMNLSQSVKIFLSGVRPLILSDFPWHYEPIIASTDQSWIDIDQNGEYDPEIDESGPFNIGIRFSIGQGRIVFLSDFTWLQNQVFFQFDNALFFDKLISWLGEAITNTLGTKPIIYFDESHLSWTTLKPQTILHAISQAQSLILQNPLMIIIYFVLIAPLIFYQFSTLVDRYIELKAKLLKEVKGESTFHQKREELRMAIQNPVTLFEIVYYKILLKWLSMDPYFNFNWLLSDPALERVETLMFLDQYLTRLYETSKEEFEKNPEITIRNLQELKKKTHNLFKFAYRHETIGKNAASISEYENSSKFCYQLAILVSKEKTNLL